MGEQSRPTQAAAAGGNPNPLGEAREHNSRQARYLSQNPNARAPTLSEMTQNRQEVVEAPAPEVVDPRLVEPPVQPPPNPQPHESN